MKDGIMRIGNILVEGTLSKNDWPILHNTYFNYIYVLEDDVIQSL
jgi:hypothetical protein